MYAVQLHAQQQLRNRVHAYCTSICHGRPRYAWRPIAIATGTDNLPVPPIAIATVFRVLVTVVTSIDAQYPNSKFPTLKCTNQ